MSKVKGIKYSFFKDRFIVVIAYVMAVLGAWISIQFFPEQDLWVKVAIADFVGTVIIFIYSLLLKNSSMYDPYWSVIPIFILLYLFLAVDISTLPVRVILVAIVVLYWGIRLTMNWLKTWPGLGPRCEHRCFLADLS